MSIIDQLVDIAVRRRPSRGLYFPLRLSERRLLLGTGDLLVANSVLLSIVLFTRPRIEPTVSDILAHFDWFLYLSITWLLAAMVLDAYDLVRAANGLRSLYSAGNAALIAGAVYWFMPFLPPPLPDRRLYVLALPLGMTVGIALWRLLYAAVFVQPRFQQQALVVGAGRSGRELAQAVQADRSGARSGLGYRIIGFVDDSPALQHTNVAGIPVLGDRHDLPRLIRLLKPTELVIAITHVQTIHADLFQAILDSRQMGVPLTTMTSLYERVTGRIPVEHAGRNLDVVLPLAPSPSYRIYLALKRTVDLITALLGCTVALALLPVIWLVNRLTAPGDIFYRQERVGGAGEPFTVYKFRSMVMDAEKFTGAVWAEEDDPRITPLGRILRKTRLDEVPQFWNVLKGEMSLVGPRPERPVFVNRLAAEIPYYGARHAVRPGITGWAQVKYRYGASAEDSLVKLQYDLYYIKHQSVLLDLEIVLKTIQVMLGMHGR